jgi:hypothetical protein
MVKKKMQEPVEILEEDALTLYIGSLGRDKIRRGWRT